jgi:prepilin-type N-terminal cleavage/methylation domain-containing protein
MKGRETGPGLPRRRRRAFTLVEILATLTLIAIVLPAVMTGISLDLAAADQARHESEAASLARTKMSELVLAGEWRQAAESGDFGEDRSAYRWTAEATDWEGDARLRQLAVTVLWTSRGRDHAVTLTTLVYTGNSNG